MCKALPTILRDTPCDLCGHAAFRLLAQRDRRGAALATVICQVCGLVAHADIPSEAELTEYYRRQYRLDYHGEYLPSPHRVVREWNRGRELLRLLKSFVSVSDQIVEIGCGMGCTVSHFQRAGFRASGIEPGDGFRRYAIEKLGITAHGGVLADLPRRPVADMVMLVHVLEHLRSPGDALGHIRTLLHDRGRCYVEVPNAGAPHAAPGKMFHFAHIYNFTRDTLSMLAAKSNFTVLRWLSSPQDKNLRVVLQGSVARPWSITSESYARSVAATTGTSSLSYFLRWTYLRQRLRTLVGHPCDRILATRRVERIVRNAPRPRTHDALSDRVHLGGACRYRDGSVHAVHSS